MTERELLETMARARHALALASWGVARAAMSDEEAGCAEGEDPINTALVHWRKAHKALGRARARWQRLLSPAPRRRPH
jgi:hypothetical protein